MVQPKDNRIWYKLKYDIDKTISNKNTIKHHKTIKTPLNTRGSVILLPLKFIKEAIARSL